MKGPCGSGKRASPSSVLGKLCEYTNRPAPPFPEPKDRCPLSLVDGISLILSVVAVVNPAHGQDLSGMTQACLDSLTISGHFTNICESRKKKKGAGSPMWHNYKNPEDLAHQTPCLPPQSLTFCQ